MAPASEWYRPGPLVIAHRGASRRAPENTLAAFRLAAELGADAIELDAKLTADGAVAVHHDLTLDRTTNGHGRLSQHTLAQLEALDAGAAFGEAFKGERLPSLKQVFEAVGGRLLINVELTNYENPRDNLPEAVIALVRAGRLERRVLLSSFNPLALRRAYRLAPEIPRGMLLEHRQSALTRRVYRWLSPHDALHPDAELATPKLITSQHQAGKLVNVWTVNDPHDLAALARLEVDGLITDVPDVAREALARASAG